MQGFRLSILVFLLAQSVHAQVLVDDFGAVGDGLTHDHVAIQAAIDAAGPGGTIQFTADKRYRICVPLVPHTGQTFEGNEAHLIKCDEYITTLAQPHIANAPSIVVSDASGFEPGQFISISDSSNHDGKQINPTRIGSISGNRLILNLNGLRSASWNTGALVSTDSPLFLVRTASNVTIEGFILDGNYPNNQGMIRWETSYLLSIGAQNIIIRNNTFFNGAGDGINSAAKDALVEGNRFVDLSGCAIHLSTTERLAFQDNEVINIGFENWRQGHCGGIVEYSTKNLDISVEGNCVHDTPNLLFVNMPMTSNYRLTMRNNRVSDVAGMWTITKTDPSDVAETILIEDNIFQNAHGAFVGSNRGFTTERLGDVTIRNNTILNGYLEVALVEDAVISGNHISMQDPDVYASPSTSQLRYPALIDVLGSDRTLISDNIIQRGRRGIKVWQLLFGARSGQIQIQDNLLLDQTEFPLAAGHYQTNLVGGQDYPMPDLFMDRNVVVTSSLRPVSEEAGVPAGLVGAAEGTYRNNCIQTNTVAGLTYGHPNAQPTGQFNGGTWTENTLIGETEDVIWRNPDQRADMIVSNNILNQGTHIQTYANELSNSVNGNVVDSTVTCTYAPPPPLPYTTYCTRSIYLGSDQSSAPPPPSSLFLQPPFPNPFITRVRLTYHLQQPGMVRAEIVNLLGQRIKTLVHAYQTTGPQTLTWDGTDKTGTGVAKGVYLAVVRSGGHQATRVVVLR